MDIKYIVTTTINTFFVALCIGTIIKFWLYGIRWFGILLSPFVVIIGFIFLPILLLNIAVFHLDKISSLEKNNDLPAWTRIKLGIGLLIFSIKRYPSFVGIVAQSVAKVWLEKKLRWPSTSGITSLIDGSIDSVLFSERFVNKLRNRTT